MEALHIHGDVATIELPHHESTEADDSQALVMQSAFPRWFSKLFIPVGRVAPEYAEFQAYDTIQAMCSYLRGILATQSILEGVGVGSGK